MKPPKETVIAAVDIGSNAIRMVLARQQAQPPGSGFHYLKRYRVPIRLGRDAFEKGRIGPETSLSVLQCFVFFKSLMEKYQVSQVRAVATSALRDSANGKELIQQIKKDAGLKIELIDGVEEAQLIHLGVSQALDLNSKQALLMDIGGGSVELTLSESGLMTSTQSFPFGTVRTLQNLKKRKLGETDLNILMGEYSAPIAHFLHSQPGRFDLMIGTGGNADALGKLKVRILGRPDRSLVSYDELRKLILVLQKHSPQARREILHLRKDRADVILPAALLFQLVMRQAGLSLLHLPNVGLKEGLLWSMRKSAL